MGWVGSWVMKMDPWTTLVYGCQEIRNGPRKMFTEANVGVNDRKGIHSRVQRLVFGEGRPGDKENSNRVLGVIICNLHVI